MSAENFRETTLDTHRLHPETLMLGYGYAPDLSQGSVKPPVFLTSTFTSPSADAARAFFDIATGRCVAGPCAGKHLEPVPFRILDGDLSLDGAH